VLWLQSRVSTGTTRRQGAGRCFRDAGYEVIYTGCHQTPSRSCRRWFRKTWISWPELPFGRAIATFYPAVTKLLKDKGVDDVTSRRRDHPEQDFQAM